jgi:hypothetical protein
MEVPKLNQKSEQIIIIAIVIIVGYYIIKGGNILFDAVDGIKDIFGGGSSAKQADTAIENVDRQSDSGNPFSPVYLANVQAANPDKKILYLTQTAREDFARKIHRAAGAYSGGLITGAIIGAKPSDILTVFKQLKTKSQVSDLSKYFTQKYKNDMLTYIVNGLRDNQPLGQTAANDLISKVISRVNSLPSIMP